MLYPKISIITVAKNSQATISDTLDSVASQTYTNYEHIIVDGLSDDTTLDIVSKYPSNKKRIYSQADDGIYDAMNFGISVATGDVVGFLNSDDTFFDQYSLNSIAQVLRDDHIDSCYGDLIYINNDQTSSVARKWNSGTFAKAKLLSYWIPPHPTFYCKLSAIKNLNGFTDTYKLAADYDLMARMLLTANHRTQYINEYLVKMRVGGATNRSLRNILRQNMEILHSRKRSGHLFSSPIDYFLLKALSRLLSIFRIILK